MCVRACAFFQLKKKETSVAQFLFLLPASVCERSGFPAKVSVTLMFGRRDHTSLDQPQPVHFNDLSLVN